MARDMVATVHDPLIRLFAPLPLPDSLTDTRTPYFFVKYAAKDLATGPTVVDPSSTMVFTGAATPASALKESRLKKSSVFLIMTQEFLCNVFGTAAERFFQQTLTCFQQDSSLPDKFEI